jgi:AcrR family transcriptional regulator
VAGRSQCDAVTLIVEQMSKQSRTIADQIRPRDATATRADLLNAARLLFSQQSYELVGLRQIAAEAGVNQALAIRYFGSKKGLFVAALEDLFSPALWFEGDRKTAGRRMAAWITSKWPQDVNVNPLALLIHSSGHPEVNDSLNKAFEAQAIKPLAVWLGGSCALERARVLTSIIIGNGVVHQILRSRTLPRSEFKIVADLLGITLQRIVDESAESKTVPDNSGKVRPEFSA